MADWMRVVDAVGGLAQLAGRFRPRPPAGPGGSETDAPPAGGGALEARLAGVVVAALKEAFDRDRLRMELEREQVDAERRRVEQALQAELHRQAVERASAQLRLIGIMAIGAWMLSAALSVWLAGMREGVPRALLGGGWLCALAALACVFAGWAGADGPSVPPRGAAVAAPWLLIVALGLIGASLIVAL